MRDGSQASDAADVTRIDDAGGMARSDDARSVTGIDDVGSVTGSDPAGDATAAVIRVAAALIVDDAGQLLLVRKAGTSVFMQPGGKYEPGETGAETLARELHEELGLVVAPHELEPLGTFTAPAANEAGMLVEAEVFRVVLAGSGGSVTAGSGDSAAPELAPGAEIAELRWVHPDEFGVIAIAPLVTERMIGLLD